SKKKNDTQYSISAIPLGGYIKLAGDNLEEYKGASYEYMAKPPIQRAAIIFFGPLLNYILGFLCFWLIFFVGYPTLTTKVGGLVDGFGAKDAGIQIGDKITAVDGKSVESWEDLLDTIQSKKTNTMVGLSILRDNKEHTIDVKIKEKLFSDALGQKRKVGLLGIAPDDETIKVRHGLLESLFLSLNKTKDLTVLTYKAIWRMITGKLSMRESVTGPLGIFYITSKVKDAGIIAVLHLMAVLSVSLAIFNLLPFPVLDGGHIALLAVEKVRGRTLSIKSERIITQAGLSLIILLAVYVTYIDLMKFFGDKISNFFK
ncbi:MAG: RIP metalloprotease RseP, partial [Candidatus Omnitrophica bacterium]|nr:RIP metalloprotease RseP [Candidatus Omnitrophota bacterium]